MSQQINLLKKAERRAVDPTTYTLLIWGLCLATILITWGVNKFKIEAARASLEVAKTELDDARALVKKRADTKSALDAEIATLTPQAESARRLLSMASDMGTHMGYSVLYTSLARMAPEDLWLTEIQVAKSGKTLSVSGAALEKDNILTYTASLNAHLSDRQYRFSSVEMAPQSLGTKEGGKPALTSTRFVLR